MGASGEVMRQAQKAVLILVVATALAVPESPVELGDADTTVAKPSVKELQGKVAKLEHTFLRVKKSCVANNVPHELGESLVEEGLKKQVPATVPALQAAIKAKNAAINKLTDACMPGEEELGETEQEAGGSQAKQVAKLQAKLNKMEKTYQRVSQSCRANHTPSKAQQKAEEHGESASKMPSTMAALKTALAAKKKALDKIMDACMPGMAESDEASMDKFDSVF